MTSAARVATSTRERTGTSVKVIWPVHWDHSEVTSRMPTIGRSTLAGWSATSISDRKSRSPALPITAARGGRSRQAAGGGAGDPRRSYGAYDTRISLRSTTVPSGPVITTA
jgi:hypothetical protein